MKTIAVIGLGYVGLPLAVEFGKHRSVVGFDINQKRIEELNKGHDRTREVEPENLKSSDQLRFSASGEDLADAQIYIVTVPTPVTKNKIPDLTPIQKASESVGRALKQGDIVIYESTVFPGCTEEFCVPILEKESGLKFNQDFFCGYSPERLNPGDKEHSITKIKKVTSGSTPAIAREIDQLYASIITAGTYLAESIKVAEAAKVIENTQRDINIAFVNELSMIFEKMGLETHKVLEAASTKWNFLPFKPGLVGGHCIGVDPYYLTYKAEELGHHPQMILSGRRINDGMGKAVASRLVKEMIKNGSRIQGAKTLVLGITFKENCPDVRNTRAIDVVKELQDYGCHVDVADPWADSEEVMQEFALKMVGLDEVHENLETYDGVVLAVGHREFVEMGSKLRDSIVFDVKNVLRERGEKTFSL